MIPNFLCPTHQQHYQQHPEEALVAWDSWMTAGHQALLNQDPEQAFSYYGSSMEVADMLMHSQQYTLSPITPFERFQLAGQHLADLCQRSGHLDISAAIKKKLQSTLMSHRHACLQHFADAYPQSEEVNTKPTQRVH